MAQNDGLVMPLQQELQYANQLTSLYNGVTGGGGGGGGPVGGNSPSIPQLTSQDMNLIMQNFLRGEGQFMQKAMQQNQSGLYNSTSRAFMANDLTANAAMKAVEASTRIAVANAQIAQANRGGGGGGVDAATAKRRARQQLALALGISGLRSGAGQEMWRDTKSWVGNQFSGEDYSSNATPGAFDFTDAEYPDYTYQATPDDFAAYDAESASNLASSNFFNSYEGSLDMSAGGISSFTDSLNGLDVDSMSSGLGMTNFDMPDADAFSNIPDGFFDDFPGSDVTTFDSSGFAWD